MSQDRTIRLWDLPLRLFHWALFICVTGAIASIKLSAYWIDGLEWHKRFGFAVLTLLIFRLLWGIIGSTHARFSQFVKGPRTVMAFLRGKLPYAPGHNPLGALSVLAMLAVLLFQAISGLFVGDGFMLEGPLYKFISEDTASLLLQAHSINPGIIIALIALHVAAIVFYRVKKKDNLLTPMITGRKSLSAEQGGEDARGGSAWLGLLVLLFAAAIVWMIAGA